MNIYVLMNRSNGLFAMRDCMGEHDGRFSDDVADAKEFDTFGACADYSQNFSDGWQPEALFDEQPVSPVFAPNALCGDLDGHPFSGAICAGEY